MILVINKYTNKILIAKIAKIAYFDSISEKLGWNTEGNSVKCMYCKKYLNYHAKLMVKIFLKRYTKSKKGRFIIPLLGGQHPPEILITLANHVICGKDFLRVPLFYPRIPKIDD